CRVDSVGESTATCTGRELRPGDTYRFNAVSAPAPKDPNPLPEPTTYAELARQRKVLERVELPLVEFDESQAAPKVFHTRLSYRHFAAIPVFSIDGSYQQELIDIQMANLRIAKNLTADVMASVMIWSQNPGLAKMAVASVAQLWVRQASLTFAPLEGRFSLMVGRTRPVDAPGLPMLDGVQVGGRTKDRTWHGGAFVGSVPGYFDLGLTTRWTAGGFIAADFRSEETKTWIHPEARVAVVTRPNVAARYEVEPAVGMQLGPYVNASTQIRFGLGSQQAPSAVDLARLDFSVHATDSFNLFLSGRYLAETDQSIVSGYFGMPAQGYHTSGGFEWRLANRFGLGLQAIYSRDLVSQLSHTLAGPELIFPEAFGSATSLRFGYQEELGWIRGRNIYAQTSYSAMEVFSVFLRLGYAGQQITGDEDRALLSNEMSLYFAFDAKLSSLLRFRASALVRSDLSTLQPTLTRGNSFSGAVFNLQLIADI
ncbi:MAG: hypothetical protein ACT4TC_06590, partial [Myxococcaceae bacterium]